MRRALAAEGEAKLSHLHALIEVAGRSMVAAKNSVRERVGRMVVAASDGLR
jgi:hypothetical protein